MDGRQRWGEDRSDAPGAAGWGSEGERAELKMMNYEQCLEHSLRTFIHSHPTPETVPPHTHSIPKLS